jgi:hypothetical protein
MSETDINMDDFDLEEGKKAAVKGTKRRAATTEDENKEYHLARKRDNSAKSQALKKLRSTAQYMMASPEEQLSLEDAEAEKVVQLRYVSGHYSPERTLM